MTSHENLVSNDPPSQPYNAYHEEAFKKAILSYPPPSVTIGVTGACANRCSFCSYHSDDAKSVSNVYKVAYMLAPHRFRRMLQMCKRGKVPRIHLCGTGEPFLHPRIDKLLESMLEVCGYLSFQTSFPAHIMHEKKLLEKIYAWSPYIRKITTDIMSGDAQEHESLKNGSDYYHLLDIMQKLSSKNVPLETHFILTKLNYKSIKALARTLIERDIKCNLALVNIHPHEFNDITRLDNVYFAKDTQIRNELEHVNAICADSCVTLTQPTPFDNPDNHCGVFWTRFQVWPVIDTPTEHIDENIIPGACNAVVRGDLKTLGNFFDYDSIMDLWNNKYFVYYREKILAGEYPSPWCKNCAAGYACCSSRCA